MPRLAIEDALRREFPALSRSQANKIARRHRNLEDALTEARDRFRGFPDGIPTTAYRGHHATHNAAATLSPEWGRN